MATYSERFALTAADIPKNGIPTDSHIDTLHGWIGVTDSRGYSVFMLGSAVELQAAQDAFAAAAGLPPGFASFAEAKAVKAGANPAIVVTAPTVIPGTNVQAVTMGLPMASSAIPSQVPLISPTQITGSTLQAIPIVSGSFVSRYGWWIGGAVALLVIVFWKKVKRILKF